MKISEQFTENNLREILINIYNKGMEKENLYVKDVIDDIIQQMMNVSN